MEKPSASLMVAIDAGLIENRQGVERKLDDIDRTLRRIYEEI